MFFYWCLRAIWRFFDEFYWGFHLLGSTKIPKGYLRREVKHWNGRGVSDAGWKERFYRPFTITDIASGVWSLSHPRLKRLRHSQGCPVTDCFVYSVVLPAKILLPWSWDINYSIDPPPRIWGYKPKCDILLDVSLTNVSLAVTPCGLTHTHIHIAFDYWTCSAWMNQQITRLADHIEDDPDAHHAWDISWSPHCIISYSG